MVRRSQAHSKATDSPSNMAAAFSMAEIGAWRMAWPVDCASTWILQASSSCHIRIHASATVRPTVSRPWLRKNHRIIAAQVRHQPLSLVHIHRNSLELMVGDALMELVRLLL